MQLRCVSQFSELNALRSQWNELAQGNQPQGSSIFQTFEWHWSWWQAFGEDRELFVLLVEEEGRLLGIAPLCQRREWIHGLPARVLRFIGSDNFASDYCDFLLLAGEPGQDDALALILEWIASRQSRWQLLDLLNMPSHSPQPLRVLDFLRKRGLVAELVRQIDAPTRHLGDSQSDQEALNKKSLKRHSSWFEKKRKTRIFPRPEPGGGRGLAGSFF